MSSDWLKWITELQAIAQNGLAYCQSEFDKERYTRIREMAAEVAAKYCNYPSADIHTIFSLEKGYATPKIDVRAFILKNNELLLARERADNLWTLPGGWADVNESPAEAIIREVQEETGYQVQTLKLLALWDKFKHDHPPQWPHAYKCFFHCEILGGAPQENIEISELKFFDINHLPELSTPRVTQKQILKLYELVNATGDTLFD